MKVTSILIIIGIILIFVIGLYFLINYLHHKHNSGWTKENIQSLSKAIYEKIKDSPITTMCLSQNNADCIANAISSNYQYDSKYEQDPLLNIPKKYITPCLSSCLGVKGNWSKAFYKEMLDTAPKNQISNTECYIKYLEKNLDPIDLLDPDFDNKNKDLLNDSVKECNVPSSCPSNCQGKSCGVDGCVGNCGTCPNKMVCSNDGKCNVPSSCPSNCQGKSCGVDGCVGNCGTCPNKMVCSNDGKCNGWSTDNIEELSNVLQNTDYIYDSFKKLCINPDSAKCLATSIASDNYNSYPGYIASQKDVIKYTPKYLGKCLKDDCAGIKGKWDQSIYNEIADSATNPNDPKIICWLKYLQSQLDPVEFLTNSIYGGYYNNSNDPDAIKANQKSADMVTNVKKICDIT
jgi:hypothetical protein